MQRRRSNFRLFKTGTCQLREKTLTEEHRSSRIAGGWHRVQKLPQKNDLSRNPKEGQGPQRAVEPMMIILVKKLLVDQLDKNMPAFLKFQIFVTVFTRVHNWALS
jgi:hypothetical protein